MLQVGAWPVDVKYLTCDDYDGSNTPDHTIDLKSYFIGVISIINFFPYLSVSLLLLIIILNE